MHFKILVVFAFTLHIYLHLCIASKLYCFSTIIFYWSKATFMVYLKKLESERVFNKKMPYYISGAKLDQTAPIKPK